MEFSNKVKDLKGSAIREILKASADPSVISFAGGNPAPELFPAREFAKISENMFLNNPAESLQYSITEGLPRLINKVCELTADNIRDYDKTIIVSGSQQGIELTAKVLINEGDTVICEEPSFIGALNAFRSYGAKLAGISMDDDGMNMEELEEVLKKTPHVKLIYTIPTFQNPSGKTMSLEKRIKLVELAKKYDVLIYEDNPYGEISFTGETYPTIKSFDDRGMVIYGGSFSKILAPGIRVGFLTGREDIVSKIVICKQASDVHTNVVCQNLVCGYLESFDLSNHIKKVRKLYKERCETMLEAMAKYFPECVTYTVPKGGLFIWCTVNGGTDTQVLAKKCSEKKVVFVPGSTFMTDQSKLCSSFRLNFSSMPPQKIEKGIKVLGEALAEILN